MDFIDLPMTSGQHYQIIIKDILSDRQELSFYVDEFDRGFTTTFPQSEGWDYINVGEELTVYFYMCKGNDEKYAILTLHDLDDVTQQEDYSDDDEKGCEHPLADDNGKIYLGSGHYIDACDSWF